MIAAKVYTYALLKADKLDDAAVRERANKGDNITFSARRAKAQRAALLNDPVDHGWPPAFLTRTFVR